LVKVLCDTSFLIHLATKRIKNIDTINSEIGTLDFFVPQVAINELIKLKNKSNKTHDIEITLNFIKNLKIIELEGTYADSKIIEFVKGNDYLVGTMDKELKKNIKMIGKSIISFNNNKMVLES
jgi:rRNA-processing protein FCF1